MNPTTNPVIKEEPHCKYYVKRKKRFCKMTLKQGFDYCGEHIPSAKNGEDENKESKTLRITCPLDNKHTCYAHKLQKHLKICNAKPNNSLPYIVKGINCGNVTPDANGTIQNARLLSAVSPDKIKSIITKVNKIFEEFIDNKIVNTIKSHQIIDDELNKPEYGDRTKKHLIQASSLVGLLEFSNLLQTDTCFIEFGAGKGQLSYWICQVIASLTNSTVLLVERASHRHKKDNKIDKSEGKVHRIKADIGDLVLNKVDVVNQAKRVVGITKHLCGDATDLTIRCMKNYENAGGKVSAIIMAFCCHHRCQWSAYIGQKFFQEQGLQCDDFDAMCGMVSWAVCGTGQSREQNKTGNAAINTNERDKQIGLTRAEKCEIGKKCKRILDYGRLRYLEENGYQTSLNVYVDANISPENVCIVALKNNC